MFTRYNWTVFVSQTGGEVYDICTSLGALPRTLVTSNLTKIDPKVLSFLEANEVEIKSIPRNPTSDDYLVEEILQSDLITLHGFLRILPAEFISNYKGTIYNGHPGLITKYPELKGKDPQVRAFEGKYPTVGSVVHEVIPEVDEGKVLVQYSAPNEVATLDDMYMLLKQTSLVAWKNFLIPKLETIKF